jgi:clan AA aspartic protease (TIGR02281 family)
MIVLDPRDRISDVERRTSPILLAAVTLVFLLLLGIGGFLYWQYAAPKSNYNEVYSQLGISPLLTLERNPEFQVLLEQLGREPCYRGAITGLADAMLDAGYPRETDKSLSAFAKRCGASDEISVRRYSALYQASDFSTALQVANELVQSDPADAQVRYWRGNAHEKLKHFTEALADYINAVQLLGNPSSVEGTNFYDISRMYAALGRYCDAITPLETYASMDPAERRTTQITKLIAEYADKGKCDTRFATGSTRIGRLALSGTAGVNTLNVAVNDVPGNFLLDTGATYVAVTSEFAGKAKLKCGTGTELQMKTVAGVASANLCYADTVKVGKAEAQGVPVAIIRGTRDPFGNKLDGLLGMSFLARYKVTVSQNAIELIAIPLR